MRVLLSTYDSRGGIEPLVHRAAPPSPDDMPKLIGDLIATWFDTVTPVAGKCDAMVGTAESLGAALLISSAGA